LAKEFEALQLEVDKDIHAPLATPQRIRIDSSSENEVKVPQHTSTPASVAAVTATTPKSLLKADSIHSEISQPPTREKNKAIVIE